MAVRASSALMQALSVELPTLAEISALLGNDRFEELERKIKDAEQAFARDAAYERGLVGLYEEIGRCDAKLAEKLDKWVNERPTYMSLTARGVYEVCRGYRLRGDKFANETPAESFKQMDAAFAKATPDLEKAVAQNPKFIPAYIALLEIAQSSGSSAGARAIEKRATAAIPGTYYVRHTYLTILQPRRGGSYSEMEVYEGSLADAAAENPRIWSLRGESWADRGKTAWENYQGADAVKFYSKALEFGDRLEFLKARGSLYINLGQYDSALRDREHYREYDSKDEEVNQDIACLKSVDTIQNCWGSSGDNSIGVLKQN
jgi:tetratricopeptide (TPR) repeat protein